MPTQKEIEFLDHIDELAKATKLEDWTSFVETLQIPGDIMPAIITQRPEMLKMVQPRQLSQPEHQAYINLIAGLIETNTALRQHAAEVARLAGNWMNMVSGMVGLAQRVKRFASFDRTGEDVG